MMTEEIDVATTTTEPVITPDNIDTMVSHLTVKSVPSTESVSSSDEVPVQGSWVQKPTVPRSSESKVSIDHMSTIHV